MTLLSSINDIGQNSYSFYKVLNYTKLLNMDYKMQTAFIFMYFHESGTILTGSYGFLMTETGNSIFTL